MSHTAAPQFRGRIFADARSGFHAAPHRYDLHLSLSCPSCLRIAITHALLGLEDSVPLTLLPAVPDRAEGGYTALHGAYAATRLGFAGPAVAPVLRDRWTGRIVSNHAPHILRDLATRFRGQDTPELYPAAAEAEIAALGELCENGINAAAQRAGRREADTGATAELLAALDAVEERLAEPGGPYLLGARITAADVRLWVTLVQLDTVHRWHLGADTVQRIADHPRLWAYARRLLALPAFHGNLRLKEIHRRHHAHCRGLEAAGAAVQIIDWTAAEPAGSYV
ncbi:glutathione S-transferase C-terminal domain-containing protein [Streptomyces sp. NPDC059853]|uniref:glutathione S-transferase C-terminal domain-containing protein n=1 Tax=Streptomyces sp. NPDC059853 TaxID=3346973 RepID=UPI0036615371